MHFPPWVHNAIARAMSDGHWHTVNVIYRGPIVRLIIDCREVRPPRAG